MINISVSPVFVLFICIIFLITGVYCLKCILFYHENKDKLNDLVFISKGYKCDEIPQKGVYYLDNYIVEYDYMQINRKDV